MPRDPELIRRARELRRNSTPLENLVWQYLRDRRRFGFKFVRQQPVGRFIADFVCRELNLIIELDGCSHAGQEAKDCWREKQLVSLGFRVLRFISAEVHNNLEGFLQRVIQVCQEEAAKKAKECDVRDTGEKP